MDIDKIERYLNGLMEPSEEESFESQMKKWPSLEDDVRTMAYIIHSIKDVALEKENERIDKIKLSSHSDRKRYITTVAALFLAIAMVTGSIATGLYFWLNDKKEGTSQTIQKEFKAPVKIEGNPTQLPKAQEEEKGDKKKDEAKPQAEVSSVTKDKVENETPQPKEEIKKEEEPEATQEVAREASYSQTKSIGNTQYVLKSISSNNGVITLRVLISNHTESTNISLENPVLMAGGEAAKLISMTFSPSNSSNFMLKKGNTATMVVKFKMNKDYSQIDMFNIKDRNSIHPARFRNISIPR